MGKNKITGERIVLKYYYWGSDKKNHAEPSYLSTLDSPCILKINHAEIVDHDWACFVSPFCQQGDLDDYIQNHHVSLYRAISLVSNILDGLSYLHKSGLLHRDIKPENIMISDIGYAVIGDFGSVRMVSDPKQYIPGSTHSILYMPPEAIKHKKVNMLGDIYQVGIILYQLLGGYMPYNEILWLNERQRIQYDTLKDPFQKSKFIDTVVKEKIINGKLINLNTLPLWVPNSIKRTIRKACNVDPCRRFQNVSDFMCELYRNKASEWWNEDGLQYMKKGERIYRIEKGKYEYIIKIRSNGSWRKSPSYPEDTLANQVKRLNRL